MDKTRTVLIFGILLVAFAVYSAKTAVQPLDPSMVSAMAKHGYDLNGNSKIEKNELKNIRSLVLSSYPISNLSGLTEANNPRLKEVYFSEITTLENYDFSLNPQITDLRLDLCNIKSVEEVNAGANLLILSLAGNKLSNLETVERFKRLSKLIVDHNEISDISQVRDLPELKYLDIRDNPIQDYTPLSDLPLIVTVYLNAEQYKVVQTQLSDMTKIDYKISE